MSKQIIKRRIKAASQIEKVTKAMSNVAGRKLSIIEPINMNANIYFENLIKLIGSLPDSVQSHQFIKNVDARKKLLIVVSTDKGLVGPLNRELESFVLNNLDGVSNVIFIGKRGLRYHLPKEIEVLHVFSDLGDYPSPEVVTPIAYLAQSLFERKINDGVSIIYQRFDGGITHTTTRFDCLPISSSFFNNQNKEHYSYDIDPLMVLENLVKEYLVASVFKSVVSGKTAEHATRIVAMQTASDNAHDMKNTLRKVSFKETQKSVTAEIADTVAARFAINSHD